MHYHHLLKPLKERAASLGTVIKFDVVIGYPAERIIIETEPWGAGLIVAGHHGHGLMGRWLLGSIAKQVLHHATCDVLVARTEGHDRGTQAQVICARRGHFAHP